MRFFQNSIDIPKKLIQKARDGEVVFFCGAGVSMAKARMPSFKELTEKSIKMLAKDSNTEAQKLLESMNSSCSEASYERVFSLLEEQYPLNEVLDTVKQQLLSSKKSTCELKCHSLIVDLAKSNTKKGVRIVTTNFDSMFEKVFKNEGMKPQIKKPPYFTNLEYTEDYEGLTYLHGKIDDYQDPNDIVLTTKTYGRAYLSEGWATKFIKQILEKYCVVFIGYSAEDPTVKFLLEGLKIKKGRHECYVFTEESSAKKFKEYGFTTLCHKDDDFDTLWKALNYWKKFHQDPTCFSDQFMQLIQQEPYKLNAFERTLVFNLLDSDLYYANVLHQHLNLISVYWLTVLDSKCLNRDNSDQYFDNHLYNKLNKKYPQAGMQTTSYLKIFFVQDSSIDPVINLFKDIDIDQGKSKASIFTNLALNNIHAGFVYEWVKSAPQNIRIKFLEDLVSRLFSSGGDEMRIRDQFFDLSPKSRANWLNSGMRLEDSWQKYHLIIPKDKVEALHHEELDFIVKQYCIYKDRHDKQFNLQAMQLLIDYLPKEKFLYFLDNLLQQISNHSYSESVNKLTSILEKKNNIIFKGYTNRLFSFLDLLDYAYKKYPELVNVHNKIWTIHPSFFCKLLLIWLCYRSSNIDSLSAHKAIMSLSYDIFWKREITLDLHKIFNKWWNKFSDSQKQKIRDKYFSIQQNVQACNKAQAAKILSFNLAMEELDFNDIIKANQIKSFEEIAEEWSSSVANSMNTPDSISCFIVKENTEYFLPESIDVKDIILELEKQRYNSQIDDHTKRYYPFKGLCVKEFHKAWKAIKANFMTGNIPIEVWVQFFDFLCDTQNSLDHNEIFDLIITLPETGLKTNEQVSHTLFHYLIEYLIKNDIDLFKNSKVEEVFLKLHKLEKLLPYYDNTYSISRPHELDDGMLNSYVGKIISLYVRYIYTKVPNNNVQNGHFIISDALDSSYPHKRRVISTYTLFCNFSLLLKKDEFYCKQKIIPLLASSDNKVRYSALLGLIQNSLTISQIKEHNLAPYMLNLFKDIDMSLIEDFCKRRYMEPYYISMYELWTHSIIKNEEFSEWIRVVDLILSKKLLEMIYWRNEEQQIDVESLKLFFNDVWPNDTKLRGNDHQNIMLQICLMSSDHFEILYPIIEPKLKGMKMSMRTMEKLEKSMVKIKVELNKILDILEKTLTPNTDNFRYYTKRELDKKLHTVYPSMLDNNTIYQSLLRSKRLISHKESW
tara:strand:- start:10752 stop:14420 length:3669 start_codon:yes stop_codon:yes gene_type:complete